MAILIKRYANRKLYNTETSRYITLKGIATLLDLGDEVRVVDNETGEDITQVALSQILVDNKRAKEDPSDTLLTQILARGGDATIAPEMAAGSLRPGPPLPTPLPIGSRWFGLALAWPRDQALVPR